MPDPEEEAYSSIFSALKHPIKRKILRMLRGHPRSFSEMLEAFRIESSHLTYHLEALGTLLYKTKDGKYGLSTFGEAATSMMYQVEEAPRAPLNLPSLPLKWKTVFAALMIGLILIGGLSYAQYQTLNRLSAEYERSEAEVEQLQQLLGQLGQVFNLENTILTNEYIVNGSVGHEIAFTNVTGYDMRANASFTTRGMSITIHSNQYVIYNPFENSTLEMKISFFVSIPPNDSMLLSVTADYLKQPFLMHRLLDWRVPLHYKDIQIINVNDDGIFYASLPSTGWYILHSVSSTGWNLFHLVPPFPPLPSFTILGNYTTQYTISFRIKNQGMYVPFFVNVKDIKTFQFSGLLTYGDPP